MLLTLRPSANRSHKTTNATGVAREQKTLNATAHSAIATSNQRTGTTVIQVNLVGADQNPSAFGEDPQPGKVNYFIGNDPTKWQTNVPTYKQVRYRTYTLESILFTW